MSELNIPVTPDSDKGLHTAEYVKASARIASIDNADQLADTVAGLFNRDIGSQDPETFLRALYNELGESSEGEDMSVQSFLTMLRVKMTQCGISVESGVVSAPFQEIQEK